MICSENELVAALHKAARAAGATTGVAEDVARAGGWITARGGDGIGAVLASLNAALPQKCAPQRNDTKASFQDARIALAGPAALDLLQAGVCDEVLFFNCDSPVLLAGLAGCRKEHNGDGYVVTDEQSRPYSIGALEKLLHSKDTRFRLIASDHPEAHEAPNSTELVVQPQAWEHLLELASAMYVPSSEQSRTAGAGAGLLDND